MQKNCLKEFILKQREFLCDVGPLPSEYLKEHVYPVLKPAMERAFCLAILKGMVHDSKQVFNVLDCIAEYLWNMNEKHPRRRFNWKPAYFAFGINKCVCRPVYPDSWVLTRDEASAKIQAFARGYIVRKQTDVQAVRNFWKKTKSEHWILNIRTPRPEPKCPQKKRHTLRAF